MQTASAGREGGRNGTNVEELEGKNDKGERTSQGINTGKRKYKKDIKKNLRVSVAIIRNGIGVQPYSKKRKIAPFKHWLILMQTSFLYM